MSYCEELFLKSLQFVVSDNVSVLRNYKANWLINPNTFKKLEYDFYIPDFKIAFEIQGYNHYIDDDQKERDNIKKELSDKNSVLLFCISPFQVRPDVIRRKILTVIYNTHFTYKLKPVNILEQKNILMEIKSYKQRMMKKYGKTKCQISPFINERIESNKNVKQYLLNNKELYFTFDRIPVKCKVVELNKRNVKVQVDNEYFKFISYNDLRNRVL